MNSYQPIKLGGNANNDEGVYNSAVKTLSKSFFFLIKEEEEFL